MFFNSSRKQSEYRDKKITFFTKIYAVLSDDQKKYIRLYLKEIDILILDCVNDCSMIEHREEDPFEFFEASDWLNSADSKERRVPLKEFSQCLEPLEWPEEKLTKWLQE